MVTYTIKSEEDAWALFEESVRGKIPEGPFDICFKNWPVLEFKIKGDNFNSSMTTKVMKGFIELQDALNRGYANARHGKANASRLTDEEREKLQIVVRVSEGSSLFKVDIQPAAEALLSGMVSKMSGPEIVTIVLGVALIAGSAVCFKSYINGKIKQKEIEHSDLMTKEETKRAELLAGAMGQVNSTLQIVANDTYTAFNTLIKASQSADSLTVAGKTIDQETLQELSQSVRETSNEIKINEACRILKVDGKRSDGFKVELLTDDGLSFSATLKDDFFHRREQRKKILTDAFWGKEDVIISATAKKLRGEIVSAVITDVQPPPSE